MSIAPLNWITVTNGIKKTATTHFRTVYTVEKIGGTWTAKVTVPSTRGIGGGTEVLESGVTFAQARKVCIDDYTRNGGR